MKKFDISSITVLELKEIYKSRLETDSWARTLASSSLLIIKTKGKSSYVCGGETYLADAENILFIPEGTDYDMYVEREGECIVIELSVAESDRLTPALLYTGGDKDIADSVKNLLLYWTLRGPAYRSKCLSELYGLLTLISSAQSFSSSLAGKYGIIHRSVKYIEKHYGDKELYTPMLAEMSGIGETYYRSIFISTFGVAPTRYIQQFRVDKAKELLVRGDLSIDEIAAATGFANASYFCKVFKTVTGQTPSEFASKARLVG